MLWCHGEAGLLWRPSADVTGVKLPVELLAARGHLRGPTLLSVSRAHTHTHAHKGGRGCSARNGGEKASAFSFRPVGKSRAEQFCGAANEHQRCVVTQEQRVDKEWGVQAGLKKGARRFGGPAGTRQSTYSGSSSSVVTHMCTSNTILSKHTGKEKCSTARRPLSLSTLNFVFLPPFSCS